MIKTQSQIPACFGKLWSGDAAECVGGPDPTFTAADGSHVRPSCDYNQTCSQRTQAARSLIPPSQLVRPGVPPHQPTQGAFSRPPYAPPTTTTTPPQYQHAQYQQLMPVNYAVPQYLTVREPVTSGPRTKRLLTEVVRSVMKSFGHTIANFFDAESFLSKPPD